MSAERFAQFLRATGHGTRRTESAAWYRAGPGFWLSYPYHRLVTPSARELRDLLRPFGGVGARFPTVTEGPGRMSYRFVCDDRKFDLDGLSANARSKVRRGMRRCTIGQESFRTLAAEGFALHVDTLRRQGRHARVRSREGWERVCRAAEQAGFEAWGARADGQLASFIVAAPVEDRVELLIVRSSREHLPAYPNNGLVFWLTRHLLQRPAVAEVGFGLESLEPVPELDEFKESVGFRRAPLRQRVVFHPLVAALMAPPPVRAAVQRVLAGLAQRGHWRKAYGLLRYAAESDAA